MRAWDPGTGGQGTRKSAWDSATDVSRRGSRHVYSSLEAKGQQGPVMKSVSEEDTPPPSAPCLRHLKT